MPDGPEERELPTGAESLGVRVGRASAFFKEEFLLAPCLCGETTEGVQLPPVPAAWSPRTKPC